MTNVLTGAERFFAQWRQSNAEGNLYGPDDLVSYVGMVTVPGNNRTVTSLTAYLANNAVFNVKDYGAVANNSTDDTAAIQAAINAASTYAAAHGGGASVYLPSGVYKVTAALLIAQPRVHLYGDGLFATVISFQPTANATCLFFGLGGQGATNGGVLYECSLRRMTISSPDTTHTKIAVEWKNASACVMEDVDVGPVGQWTGASSIALHTRGRELCTFQRLNLQADLPIVIDKSPDLVFAALCADHVRFHDLYLTALLNSANACITVADGVVLTNTTFSGRQAWVQGKYGFYWNSTTSPSPSNNLTFENVRVEQNSGSPSGGFMFYININAAMQGLRIVQASGAQLNGYYFRGVQKATLANCYYNSASLIALDTDATVGDLEFQNCFWQTGCTSNLTGMRQIIADVPSTNSSVLPSSAKYTSTNNTSRGLLMPEPFLTLYKGGVADSTTVTLGGSGMQGFLVVCDSEGLTGTFIVSPFGARVTKITDASGVFGVAVNTATSTNVYWDGTNYTLQNKRGNPRSYNVVLLGVFQAIT